MSRERNLRAISARLRPAARLIRDANEGTKARCRIGATPGWNAGTTVVRWPGGLARRRVATAKLGRDEKKPKPKPKPMKRKRSRPSPAADVRYRRKLDFGDRGHLRRVDRSDAAAHEVGFGVLPTATLITVLLARGGLGPRVAVPQTVARRARRVVFAFRLLRQRRRAGGAVSRAFAHPALFAYLFVLYVAHALVLSRSASAFSD